MNLQNVLAQILNSKNPYQMIMNNMIKGSFDKLDAFTATSGMHIINLTATEVPQSFLAVVQAIRSDFKSAGCVINSEFRLHVTLGRVKDPHVQLPELQKMLEALARRFI